LTGLEYLWYNSVRQSDEQTERVILSSNSPIAPPAGPPKGQNMTDNRRTVRLSDDQTEQVAKIADYLHITESQVLRAGIDQMWIGYGEEAERFAVEAARLRGEKQ